MVHSPHAAALTPWVSRALDAIHREYPSHVAHVLNSDGDARPPRQLTPVFFGSFDWHSAVHGHWCIARGLRAGIAPDLAARVRAALDRSFSAARIAGEIAYLSAPGRAGFERPYGLAWLLLLVAELEACADPQVRAWREALRPLESMAIGRLLDWLPKLRWPIRSGEHSQTAFALGLALDWARVAGHDQAERLLAARTRELYEPDREAPIAYEPSGHDFLSPALGEADLMRRVLEGDVFATWLEQFLPRINSVEAERWLTPVVTSDRADGKLAHLDGLNLSRAWMLDGIASALPGHHRWIDRLQVARDRHAEAGITAALASAHYAGTHWLGSFVMYLVTKRGIEE